MVTVSVGGKAVGWADAEAVFAAAARTEVVEFRDAAGNVIASSTPALWGDDLDWNRTVIPEEAAHHSAEPFSHSKSGGAAAVAPDGPESASPPGRAARRRGS